MSPPAGKPGRSAIKDPFSSNRTEAEGWGWCLDQEQSCCHTVKMHRSRSRRKWAMIQQKHRDFLKNTTHFQKELHFLQCVNRPNWMSFTEQGHWSISNAEFKAFLMTHSLLTFIIQVSLFQKPDYFSLFLKTDADAELQVFHLVFTLSWPLSLLLA